MPDSPSPLSFRISSEAGARGVIVTDIDHKIAYIDSRICQLLGVEGSELIGGEIGQVVHNVLKNRFKDPDEYEKRSMWLAENPTQTVEDVMELAKAHRVLHRYSTPLLDDKGQPTGRIEVYSDITKRRQLEETNSMLYKQMCSAYDELRAAQDQLVMSEKLRAIGEIASGVAHDFNNTLGIILGNIQLLLRKAEDEKTRSRLQAVEQAALDGAETVRRIREFTKIQPDEPLSLVNLSELASSVVNVMRPSWESSADASQRRVDVQFDLQVGVLASGIAAEIREVLTNIILNSVQAMPSGGNIFISTGKSDGYASISVRDTGIGMTDEVKKRIFDPFFTTKGVEGTGLGMSVAYGIVKRHNGQLSIDSTPNEGTTICISLPAAEPGSEIVAGSKTLAGAKSVEPVRILVVDDEELLAQVFVDMLSEDGHFVCVAGSGRAAIDQFKQEPFDLVFTDLGMPEMSGWQVAKGIKDIEPSTPVVLVTGWGTKVDEGQLKDSKIDMVLSKPVKIDDLSSAVSRVLSQKKQG